ncbi:MAG TPA: LuxR C-terminal-related transcriptional regulator, partial [Iamia sp.]|nr:LuxR C-terminal-related transcriptional regulator [Iamia sp.]
ELDAVDDATSAVLHHAVTAGRARLLATVRDDDPAGSDASLAWWRDIVVRVELPALDRDGSDELVERLAGGPVDAATRERLWLLARGHPGWLVAAVGATRAAGAWVRDSGLWCLTGDLAATADPEVLAQVDSLPAEVRNVLQALALADQLTIDDAEGLGGSGPLAEAERRGLVRVDEGKDGGLWCGVASRLVATALGATRDPAQARASWRRLADVLARSTSAARETSMNRGLALVGAGWADPPRDDDDLEALVRGAEAAFEMSRWEDCVALAERAWRAGAGGRALQVLTVSLGHLGDPAAIAALSDDLDGLGLDEDAVVTHSDTIAISQFHANDPDHAFATAARAREAAPERRASIDVFESRLRSFGGDQPAARALVAPWVDDEDVELAIEARTVMASVDLNEGNTAAAIEEFDRVFALASATPEVHIGSIGVAYLFRLGAVADGGGIDDAIEGALAVERATASGGDPASHGWLALHLGRCHLRAGRPRSAARWFAEAVSDLRRVHRPGWLAHPSAGLVAAHAALGDLAAAREAHAGWAELPAHAVRIFRPEELRFVAWLDAAEGQAAGPRLREAIALAQETGMVPYEAAAWHDLARLGDPDDRAEAADGLADVAQRTDSRLVATHARRARAALDGDVAALALAGAAYEAMGAGFDAIEAWAEVARQADDERQSAQARRRVGDLAVQGEGLHTPGLDAVDTHPVLTDREAEIAAMVVAGASRQEIAEHLVVSVRTIDSHLQRVYRKLGVRGREGLVEALGGAGRA